MGSNVRRIVFLGWVLMAGCRGGSPTASSDPPLPQGPHERMVEILRKQKEESLQSSSLFGDAKYKEALWSLENLPLPPVERYDASYFAGLEAKRLGRMEEAVAHLRRARELYPQIPQATRDQHPESLPSLLLHLSGACLRLGEQQNCIACQTCDSCVFPIRPGGVHENQEGSKLAVGYLEELLALRNDHPTARWLLNLAHMTLGTYPDGVPAEYRMAEQPAAAVDFPRFVNVAIEAGLNAVSLSGGVVADDFDGDGWLDVVVSDWGHAGQLRYFRNKQDGTFEERVAEAGIEGLFGGLNLIQADYDNDGDLDLLVLRGAWLGDQGRHYNSLLQNDGQGRFRDVTFSSGLAEPPLPTQTAAWADYDNDGDLDLFIGNESLPCQLFENDGQGHFRDVAQRAGVENLRYSKGVAWGDFNNDDFPDLYVSNYGTPSGGTRRDGGTGQFVAQQGQRNRLYRNNKDGTFTDVAEELGVAGPSLSFPAWFWDFDNDGAMDLFVASYAGAVVDAARDALGKEVRQERLALYQGDSQGRFRDVAEERGLAVFSLTMGANFGDLDNDGYLDAYFGTGYPDYEGLMPNRMFRNQEGTGFEEVTTAGGFGLLQKGHGIAFADLDNDGDQDVVAELGGAFPGDTAPNALLKNPGFGNHWIAIRLVGSQSNRSAIGARITVTFEDQGTRRSVYRWVGYGSSFGGNPLRQEIGVGQAEKIREIEIYWPRTGQRQVRKDVAVDQFLEIKEEPTTGEASD